MNDTNPRRLTIARAMAEAVQQEMQQDPKVFVMGEDIGALGGVFGNTRGLLEEFGSERIRDTPISETAFIGAGVGAAQDGMRPIVELMFVDFFGVCFDAIYNNMAKNNYFSGGNVKVPMVIMTSTGGTCAYYFFAIIEPRRDATFRFDQLSGTPGAERSRPGRLPEPVRRPSCRAGRSKYAPEVPCDLYVHITTFAIIAADPSP